MCHVGFRSVFGRGDDSNFEGSWESDGDTALPSPLRTCEYDELETLDRIFGSDGYRILRPRVPDEVPAVAEDSAKDVPESTKHGRAKADGEELRERKLATLSTVEARYWRDTATALALDDGLLERLDARIEDDCLRIRIWGEINGFRYTLGPHLYICTALFVTLENCSGNDLTYLDLSKAVVLDEHGRQYSPLGTLKFAAGHMSVTEHRGTIAEDAKLLGFWLFPELGMNGLRASRLIWRDTFKIGGDYREHRYLIPIRE